ncbi:hypothetical protein RN001_014797 [Aquatica leii]|uniref:SHSP domain-containing protein n=1 Tax=Aquatica leii TaxID=1421715 RepID=A0AAN7P108_9COLE|nr:hypothetical protein RN001_014797 [Aquatica leii]
MSLLPIIFRDIERPLRMLERQMQLAEEAFPYLDRNDLSEFQLCNRHDSVTQDKEKFQVKMDVKHFTPEEITVKTTDENMLIVEAKHKSENEKGSISRHYIRQFLLPEGHDIKKVETKLSGNGMLTITAPNKVQQAIQDRTIPVTHRKEIEKMSLLPIIFRDIERPLRMLERQMQMAEEAFPYLDRNNPSEFQLCNRHDFVTQDKEKFQVKMDVKHFTPEEITVKTTDENMLIVEAKHESENEKGSISRHYIRQFLLPEGHDIKKVETKLSGNGMLTITAPNKVQPAIQDRTIPVTHVEMKK